MYLLRDGLVKHVVCVLFSTGPIVFLMRMIYEVYIALYLLPNQIRPVLRSARSSQMVLLLSHASEELS